MSKTSAIASSDAGATHGGSSTSVSEAGTRGVWPEFESPGPDSRPPPLGASALATQQVRNCMYTKYS